MCQSGKPPLGRQAMFPMVKASEFFSLDTCFLSQLQSWMYNGWILYPDNGDSLDNCPKLQLLCPQIPFHLQIKRNDYMQALVTEREAKGGD